MLSIVARIIIGLLLRVVRRAVEAPIALIFGVMIELLILVIVFVFLRDSPQTAISVYEQLIKYLIVIPLGLPAGTTDVSLGTDETFRLFGIWFGVYFIASEIVSAAFSFYAPKRLLPSRRILLGILFVGYTFAAFALSFIHHPGEESQPLAWFTLEFVVMVVAAASLSLSWLIAQIAAKLERASSAWLQN